MRIADILLTIVNNLWHTLAKGTPARAPYGHADY